MVEQAAGYALYSDHLLWQICGLDAFLAVTWNCSPTDRMEFL
jgi:hypothetical protein